MTSFVAPLIWVLTLLAWTSTIVLVRAARRAHIGALTERAVLATVLSVFGTAYSFVVFNADVVRVVAIEQVVALVRGGVILLLLVPVYWMFLYRTGRLGDDGKGGP